MVRGARPDPVDEALAGGDDYELLFTVRPRARGRLAAAARHGDVPLTRIGVCTADRAVLLQRGGDDAGVDDAACRAGSVTSDDSPDARRSIRRWLDALLHIDDTPRADGGGVRARRVLRLLAVPRAAHAARRSLFAFLLNLNRVAVLLGVYSNLPWIIAPYYAFATMVGAR